MHRLSELVETLPVLSRTKARNPEIQGISYHTSTVSEGHLFIACDGEHTDGHRFIDAAIRSGAVAIIHRKHIDQPREGIAYVRVDNPRLHMAAVSAAYYNHPSREVTTVGITGTNGKSTTAFYTSQLLTAAGYSTGLLSTTFLKIEDAYEKNPYGASTPESIEVQTVLRRIVDAGNRFAVVEATSHGLSLRNNRLGSIDFDAAVFTNLTHEHLEFHGGMNQYRYDKANLFRYLDNSRSDDAFGVVNGDSPEATYFVDATKKPVYTYSITQTADLYATNIQTGINGSRFRLFCADTEPALGGTTSAGIDAEISAPGTYNIENTLAALLVVSRLTRSGVGDWLTYLPELTGVPGRMQRIDKGQPFALFVDFAHSPDAFARMLPLVRDASEGRLIVVFGSAGERDATKRPLQGEIADVYADYVILADEDPRGESPEKIIQDIADGCKRHTIGKDLFLIPDRTAAIERAFSMATPGDTVLLLGKGHEPTIEYAHGITAWDETRTAESLLRALGYQ